MTTIKLNDQGIHSFGKSREFFWIFYPISTPSHSQQVWVELNTSLRVCFRKYEWLKILYIFWNHKIKKSKSSVDDLIYQTFKTIANKGHPLKEMFIVQSYSDKFCNEYKLSLAYKFRSRTISWKIVWRSWCTSSNQIWSSLRIVTY